MYFPSCQRTDFEFSPLKCALKFPLWDVARALEKEASLLLLSSPVHVSPRSSVFIMSFESLSFRTYCLEVFLSVTEDVLEIFTYDN